MKKNTERPRAHTTGLPDLEEALAAALATYPPEALEQARAAHEAKASGKELLGWLLDNYQPAEHQGQLEGVLATTGDAEYALTDWPAGYVEEVRENLELDLAEDEELLARLVEESLDMRGGDYIDLNYQAGYYLKTNNGKIKQADGSATAFVIAAMDHPSISITADGDISWVVPEEKELREYCSRSYEKVQWALTQAEGPVILQAVMQHKRGEPWFWLTAIFLDQDDHDDFYSTFHNKVGAA